MGARDLLDDLASAGLSVTAAGDRLFIRPASKLTDPMRAALREAKPELLALLSDEASNDCTQPVAIPTQTCAGCQNLTRRKTCTEPAAAGLDPPPGLPIGAAWFGIRWPPAGHGATCPAFEATQRETK